MSHDVSQPLLMPPAPNAQYGTQRRVVFAAGEARPAQLLEAAQPTQYLWRVTAQATNAQFLLEWGTYGTQRLENLRSPLTCNIPGRFALSAIPIDLDAPMTAIAALSVSSGGVSTVRRFVSAPGDLGPLASRARALAAATVTVNGIAVVLAAGAELELVAPSALTAGGPILVEHAI